MNMVMTILEGQVAPEKWQALEQAYQEEIKQLEAGITQTFLLHHSADSASRQLVPKRLARIKSPYCRWFGVNRG